jgi:D-serine deaminase-like pyridoxal phosphate-dependent protein
VVSTPAQDRAVVDAGSKALSADLKVAGLEGYGFVLDRPDLTVARLSEEHAVLTASGRIGLSIGDRLAIVPGHVCTTVNLHARILLISTSGPKPLNVDARGWESVTPGPA